MVEPSGRKSSPKRSPGRRIETTERELWRVEAGRGAQAVRARPDEEPETYGVFDLSFDWEAGSWQLVGCLD